MNTERIESTLTELLTVVRIINDRVDNLETKINARLDRIETKLDANFEQTARLSEEVELLQAGRHS